MTTPTIYTEGNSLTPDTYLELWDFDYSMLHDVHGAAGSITYLTNTPTGGLSAGILWRGHTYYPAPFEVSGIDSKGDGTNPGRPTIAVSNVNQFFLASILTYANLIGMKIRRWRTYYKFTDAGSAANINQYMPLDEWYVTRKSAQTKMGVQFELSGYLDRPGLRLPKQQILRDSTGGNTGFPGVGALVQ